MRMRQARWSISCVLLSVILIGAVAFAQGSYPSKPITLVTHSSVGAGGDIFLRNLSKNLEGIVTVPLVVENRRGGGSATAVTFVATSPVDGYVM